MRRLYIRIRTEEQLRCLAQVLKAEAKVSASICVLIPVHMKDDQVSVLKTSCAQLYADLPFIARENMAFKLMSDINEASWAEGIVVKNVDELGIVRDAGIQRGLIGDSFLYAYNREAEMFYLEYFPGMEFIAPDELTDDEIEKLPGGDKLIMKVYGRARVMLTAQSMAANYGDAGSSVRLESARHDRFIVLDEEYDQTAVYTAEPVSMLDKLKGAGWKKIMADFTAERKEETCRVLDTLIAWLRGKETGDTGVGQPNVYRGHHYKGID